RTLSLCSQQRLQYCRAQLAAALAVPSDTNIRQVRVVLERHFESQRQAAERVANPFRCKLERILLVLARRIAMNVLKIRARSLQVRDELGLRAALLGREARQHFAARDE